MPPAAFVEPESPMKLCATCNRSFADTETFCPHDGEVLHESPEEIVGRVIDGKYQVESFIAQGGMGAVYRARHILLGDQVVIKTLRPEMRGNAEWLKRFQREGKAARAFRHPNSVTVYDLSAGSDGLIYMVMEYVEGHTLDSELKRRGRFTPPDALAVLEPVADVLDSAHGRGVVHRDLKPENIMLGRDDRGGVVVKVLDLGIAKMVGVGDAYSGGATSLTVAGQLLGTPYYMSPEQWGEMPRDGNPEVDGRTDIYSLGVIFFELIAGRKPLGGRTLAELRQKHVAAPLPMLGEVAPEVSEEFGRWVARAMAKDRADRPQAAGELIDGLRASLGMPAHTRGSGLRGADAPRLDAAAHGLARDEAATARLSSETSAEAHTHGTADTLLTSDFDAPAPASDRSRETSAQRPSAHTSGNAAPRHDASRETLVGDAYDTRAGADAGRPSAQTSDASARASAQGAVVATRVAPAVDEGRRRTLAPLLVGGVLALLLLAGVGAWLALRDSGTKAVGNNNVAVSKPPAPGAAAPTPEAPAAATKVEAASYWFEAFDKPEDETGKRIAEPVATLLSEQRFRFHFTPKERGYLYIIVPGKDGNAQSIFLSGRGVRNLKTNLVGAGADFVFPSWDKTKLRLDSQPGSDVYTFIFSPRPLTSPAFLAGEAERELTPAEVSELEDFRAQFKSDSPTTSVSGDGGERRVVVSIPATAEGRPLIFDLRINHR
jgi:eukaryotic-like serine/threonine-protein kinase